ncbi:Chloramphenicol acetyltransferase-like domain protein [Apiospora saccharicola]
MHHGHDLFWICFHLEDVCKILAGETDTDAVKRWTTPDPAAPEKHHFPASLVHAVALDRGLVVRVYVYHTLFDGHMRSHFIDCLAAATRGAKLHDSPSQTSIPFDYDSNPTFEERLAACPELFYLDPQYPAPTNPRQLNMFLGPRRPPPRRHQQDQQGLRLRPDEINEPQTRQRRLSSYSCIAALTFAHVVKARLRSEGYKYFPKAAHASTAILRHQVDFRKRAFTEHMGDYFGNATVSVSTRVDQQLVLGAAGATGKDTGEGEAYVVEDFHDGKKEAEMLAELAEEVKRSIDEVNEEYVRARLAVGDSAPDPRRLGLDYDLRQPQVLGFNNWRHTGGKENWALPSGEQEMPEAFRLTRGYSMCNALILLQRQDTDDQDVLVSLSEDAMKELLQDKGWMRWVSEIRD